MKKRLRSSTTLLGLMVSATLLQACARGDDLAYTPPPLTPVPVDSVTASNLPPISSITPDGGPTSLVPGATPDTNPQDLQAIPNTIARNTGVVASQEITVGPDIDFDRNAVLGTWNVATVQDACPLSLNLTAWTGGFRASTRKCTDEALTKIGAWQLSGKQLTLLDADGALLANLVASGPNRFDGTTDADNQAISVFR